MSRWLANEKLQAAVMVALVGGLLWIVPDTTVDPWSLFNPHKILQMIWALILLQILTRLLVSLLGNRHGMIVMGYLAGFISSTALTVDLARKSKVMSKPAARLYGLSFLSATLGMLTEAMALVYIGLKDPHWNLFLVFVGPALITLLLLVFRSHRARGTIVDLANGRLVDIPAILKLSAFIVSMLGLAKILQQTYGNEGLGVLTFLTSLFEMHGSVIANIQLHDTNAISLRLTGILLSITLASSYLSKFGLIWSLGGRHMKIYVTRWTLVILASLMLSCWFFLHSLGAY